MHNDYSELQSEVKRYYQQIERYDWVNDTKYPEKLFHILRANKVVSIVNKYTANDHVNILDVGCGTGLITRKLNSPHITALDINPWALERARLNVKNDNVNFVLGDAEELPFSDGQFDIVVCTEMLEHIVRPDLALECIYRILKPEALLIGSVPSKNVIWKLRKTITSTSPVQEPFHNNYNIKEFKSLLSHFDILKIWYCIFGLTIVFIAQKRSVIPLK
jgi:ubiquinone/menaquinone biosynthesis C-methylase UbiE